MGAPVVEDVRGYKVVERWLCTGLVDSEGGVLVQFSRLEFVNVGAILSGFLLEEFSGKCLATERVS